MIRVIFDMDGTLLDLPVAIDRVRNKLATLFAPLGYQHAFRPILPAIEAAAEHVGDTPKDVRRYRNQAKHILAEAEVAASERAVPRPFAIGLVSHLVQRGVSLGLVTDNGRACVKLALGQAGFEPAWWPEAQIASRDDVAETKPSPEGLLRVIAALDGNGLDETVWYVGDTARDVAAGRAAACALGEGRIITVAVQGGRSSDDALFAAGADYCVADIGALAGLVDRNAV